MKSQQRKCEEFSIEDFDSEAQEIYEFTLAVERMEAAVEAVRCLNMPFQLTARAENLLRGVDDMGDTIKRLQAFEAAGANVADLHANGATRISLGGALNWHAVNPVLRAGREMLANGTFEWTNDVASKNAIKELLS